MPLLIRSLRLRPASCEQQAASTLNNVAAASYQNTHAILAAGAVPLLVDLLRAGQPAVQKAAAGALGTLQVHNSCSRCRATTCCFVEVSTASCARASSSRFVQFCRWLSAKHGRNHCSRRCASACCSDDGRQPAVQEKAALWTFSVGSQQTSNQSCQQVLCLCLWLCYVQPASCESEGSRRFIKPFGWLSAKHGRNHCSRRSAFASLTRSVFAVA